MKSVTLLFPSAKARLRGPLQPKPSFQPASSSEKANTSHHTEWGPIFPETFIPADEGWWEALLAGAGLPGSARAHSPASAKCPLTSPSHWDCKMCRGKAQNGANGGQRGKRHNKTIIFKNTTSPTIAAVQGQPVQKLGCTSSSAVSENKTFSHSRAE